MRKYFSMKLLIILLFAFSANSSLAQNKTITGTITDDKGDVLSGATVSVKNTSLNTLSNSFGVFTMSIPVNAKTMVVSYVGMKTQEIPIGKTDVFKVSLNAIADTLNDVVVIGYGTAKRANISSAISSISEKDIKNLPVAGADQMIQGKIPGVTVTTNSGQPGGGVSVQIRGVT